MYKTILIMTIAATMAQAANAQPGIGLTDKERAATEKHKKELARRSRLNGEEAFATLCIKYYVPKSKSKELSDLVMLRERRKAAYDYIYEKSPAEQARSWPSTARSKTPSTCASSRSTKASQART